MNGAFRCLFTKNVNGTMSGRVQERYLSHDCHYCILTPCTEDFLIGSVFLIIFNTKYLFKLFGECLMRVVICALYCQGVARTYLPENFCSFITLIW